MIYRLITRDDYSNWSIIIQELWPMNEEKLRNEFNELFTSQTGIGAFDNEMLAGVVHVAIRTDYVAGTSTSPDCKISDSVAGITLIVI